MIVMREFFESVGQLNKMKRTLRICEGIGCKLNANVIVADAQKDNAKVLEGHH